MGIFTGLGIFYTPGVPEKARVLAEVEGARAVSSILDDPTHVIADSCDSPEVTEAKDCLGVNVSIVRSTWIELSVKCGRLLPTRAFSPEQKQLFRSQRITISEITQNDAAVLWAAIETYGGSCLKELDASITHLVCGRASGRKYSIAMEERKISIVTPDWITDCIRDQILLPTEQYHPHGLLELQLSSTPPLNPSDENLIESLLTSSEFTDILNSELQNAPAQAAAMDSLSASINAVIAQSADQEARNAAQASEASSSQPLSTSENNVGFDSGSQGKVIMSPPQPNAAIVRPQTKTALAKFLNTRLSSNTQDQGQSGMGQPLVSNQSHHQLSPQPHSLVPMPPQMPEPGQIQASQQQHWQQQWKQQQAQQQSQMNQQQQLVSQHQQQFVTGPAMTGIPATQQQQQQQSFVQMQMGVVQSNQPQLHQQMYQMPQNSSMQFSGQGNQYNMSLQNQLTPHNQQQIQQRQPIPMQHNQQVMYSPQVQIRQPPPYQQVVQRPVQMMQRMDIVQNQQQHYVQNQPITSQVLDNRGIDISGVMMQQQLLQQSQQLQVRPNIDQHSQMQQPQQRPVLQTQVSVDMKAPPKRMMSHQELVYVGLDCANVPPMKFLIGCKIVLPEQREGSGIEGKTLRNIETIIKKYSGQVVPQDMATTTATHVICETQMNSLVQAAIKSGKRVVTLYWLNDCYRKGQMLPPWRFAHVPPTFSENDRPLKSKLVTVTGFHDDEREDVIALLLTLGAKYQPFLDREVQLMICKSTGAKKFAKAAEWGIPAVNVTWLHDVWQRDPKPLIVLNKDPKYVFFNYDSPIDVEHKVLPAHLMSAWLTPVSVPPELQSKITTNKGRPINAQNPKKRIKKQMMDNECKKKRKLGPIVILFDGVDKSEENKLSKSLKGLGASITEKFHVCTHLVTPRVARTPKFLIAFNACRYVVSPKWILDSVDKGKFLEPEDFIPQDNDSESRDSFTLKESIERKAAFAQTGAQVFTNVHFFITPRVYPQADTLAEIIDSAGGKTIKHRMPKLEELKTHGKHGMYFAVVASVSDYKDLASLIKIGHQLVFSSIIKQKIDWGASRLDFSRCTASDGSGV